VARKGGQIYLDRHTMTPRGQKLRAWFLHYGMVTVFIPALVPIPMPLKLFVICSGGFAVSRVVFLTTLGTARVARYGTLAWIGSQLSESPLDWLKTHKWDFLGFSAGLFLALFLLIRLVDYRKRKQQQDRLDSGHGNTPLP
jgi:membrane protein DedA with SNARE-associated domain